MARSAARPAAARAGVHPSYASRRSNAWQTPKSPDDAPVGTAPNDPPPLREVPIRVDPDMPLDRVEFENEAGETIGAITGVGPSLALPSFSETALQFAPMTPKEIDYMWDWVRADRDAVYHFIGFIPETAIALYQWCENFMKLQGDGRSWFQAIYLAGQVVGFVMLYPIVPTTKGAVGDCHIYLAKDVRGNLPALLPMLMAEADRVIPNIALRVVTARDDEWVRLLRGVGFTAQIVLTRPAAAALTGGNVGP